MLWLPAGRPVMPAETSSSPHHGFFERLPAGRPVMPAETSSSPHHGFFERLPAGRPVMPAETSMLELRSYAMAARWAPGHAR